MTDAAAALTAAASKQADEAAARYSAKEVELEAKTKELEELNAAHEVIPEDASVIKCDQVS